MTDRATREAAPSLPIARVLPLLGLAHLDREFDYQVDSAQDESAQPGVRVRVRFAGRLVDGYLIERRETTDHPGKLGWLERVVSPEQVLTPDLARLSRAVADRYAGTLTDVLRLAIPLRHARTEKALQIEPPPPIEQVPDLTQWHGYTHGEQFVAALDSGAAPRAAWQALPGEDWPRRLAEIACHTVISGKSAIIVVPDQRDLNRLEAACTGLLGEHVVALAAGLGPSARYRRWLRVLRGAATVTIGTRSAIFAPARDLGLIVVWDDGDESLCEPRAPYPHTREVAVLRAHDASAALVIGGYSRTAETQALVDSGWARDLIAPRSTVRERMGRVIALSDSDERIARDRLARAARIPTIAFDTARRALEADRPVLVSVPRWGYVPALACASCGTPARCRRCHGPLQLQAPEAHRDSAAAEMRCKWCGHGQNPFRCPDCGGTRARATVVGAKRTAEELGRAFPGVPVVTSGGSTIVDDVADGPRLVVATPGAEPVAEAGYGAALLLDTWALLGRADLRAAEEALRRWLGIVAQVRPDGATVLLADAGLPVVQGVIRFDPVGFAGHELAGRAEVGLPPAVTMASVDGAVGDITDFVSTIELPEGADVLGPVELPVGARPPAGSAGPGADRAETADIQRILLRINRGRGRELAAALRTAQVLRATARATGTIRVQVDPQQIG